MSSSSSLPTMRWPQYLVKVKKLYEGAKYVSIKPRLVLQVEMGFPVQVYVLVKAAVTVGVRLA